MSSFPFLIHLSQFRVYTDKMVIHVFDFVLPNASPSDILFMTFYVFL